MMTGLMFATEEAERQGGALAATLPFGGMTLMEYQARLLAAAGVGQILVAVARVTPALAGAVNRIARRGITIDVVRSAEEALARAHPMATLLVLADGLVTTGAVVAGMAREPADTLLTTPPNDTGAVERVDAAHGWAGVATLSIDRLAEAARLPQEYDFQSTLLRVATQARATQVALSLEGLRAGHGIERDAATLEARGREILSGMAARRRGWIDRFALTPLTRLLLPALVRHRVPGVATAAVGGAIGVGGLAAIPFWSAGAACVLVLIALPILGAGALLARLRGEGAWAGGQEQGAEALGYAALVGIGIVQSLIDATGTAACLSVAGVLAAILARRLPLPPEPWGAGAASGVALLAPFALTGQTTAGLGLVALHGCATIVHAVERLRRQG